MANALVPELGVSDFNVSKRFYCETLGFDCLYERPEEGFAYLSFNGAKLMIDQIGLGRTFGGVHLPDSYPFGRGMNLQLEVTDIANLLARITALSYPLSLPLENKWYRKDTNEVGNRQFVVADPDGYLLRFFQSLGSRPLTEL